MPKHTDEAALAREADEVRWLLQEIIFTFREAGYANAVVAAVLLQAGADLSAEACEPHPEMYPAFRKYFNEYLDQIQPPIPEEVPLAN